MDFIWLWVYLGIGVVIVGGIAFTAVKRGVDAGAALGKWWIPAILLCTVLWPAFIIGMIMVALFVDD